MSKRAIIVVDLQNEYLPSGKLPLVGIERGDRQCGQGDRGGPLRGRQGHPSSATRIGRCSLLRPGTPGVEIIPAVLPAEGRGRHHQALSQLLPGNRAEARAFDAEGIEDVVIVGAMSHMCIDATSRAAADFGYSTIVVHDACATRDLEFNGKTVPAAQVHAAYMSALAFAYGKVVTTDDLTA